MQPLRVTPIQVMPIIKRWDTPHAMLYQVGHGSDSETSDNEESLPETTTTAIPSSSIALVSITVALDPPTATRTSSIPPAIEESLTHLQKG